MYLFKDSFITVLSIGAPSKSSGAPIVDKASSVKLLFITKADLKEEHKQKLLVFERLKKELFLQCFNIQFIYGPHLLLPGPYGLPAQGWIMLV